MTLTWNLNGAQQNTATASNVSYVQMHWYGRLHPVRTLVTKRGVWRREPGHAWHFTRGASA